jgi:hypothetical protein
MNHRYTIDELNERDETKRKNKQKYERTCLRHTGIMKIPESSVADIDPFDTDPDPVYNFYTDPDPTV